MGKKISYLVIIALCAGLVSCGMGSGKTLVSVNGKDITEGDLEFLSEINPRIKSQIATPFGKKQILDNLVEQEVLYQAATKKGLQRDSQVRAKIDLYKKVIIAQSLIDAEIESAAKKYYDEHKDEFEKLQLSHIMIKYASAEKKAPPKKVKPKDEATRTKALALELANKVKARLDKGEDFAVVAKDASEDKRTKARGGDLGLASKTEGSLERLGYGPLLEKAFAMQVGETAGPIETKDGYHIITVTKGAELQPYEQVEQAVVFKIRGEKRDTIIADLKKGAKIVYAEDKKKKEEAKPEQPAAPQPEAAQPGAQPQPPAAAPDQK